MTPPGLLRLGTAFLTLGLVALSGWGALVGITFGFGLKCDDRCSTLGSWRDDPQAWQWQAFGFAGIGLFLSALVLLGAVVLGRTRAAVAAFVAWALIGLAFAALLDGSGLA